MSKRTVAKAILREMKVQLALEGYRFAERASDHEVYIFEKETAHTRIALQYSLSGRGAYSASGSFSIVYTELTSILHRLFEGTPLSDDYDLDIVRGGWQGVGIRANVERFSNESTTCYCASEDEAQAFATLFARKISVAEQAFVLPHLDPAITLKAFMKPMHAFWPGPLRSFLEHLIAHGIKAADSGMIAYALQKAETVCEKLVPEARPLDFIAALKRHVQQLDFVRDAGLAVAAPSDSLEQDRTPARDR